MKLQAICDMPPGLNKISNVIAASILRANAELLVYLHPENKVKLLQRCHILEDSNAHQVFSSRLQFIIATKNITKTTMQVFYLFYYRNPF